MTAAHASTSSQQQAAPELSSTADDSVSMAEIVGHAARPNIPLQGGSLLDDFSSAFVAAQPAATLTNPAQPPRIPLPKLSLMHI